MAIRFSPGCGCCRAEPCVEATLQWIPSSPYDRGEYTDTQRWRPFTEYMQGDQFWEFALDRNGDTHRFLFTAPATMMSGGGWTLTEEARYSRGRGISYADGLQDFDLFGDGWPGDEILLHEALQTRRLRERQGIVSRQELAKTEWIATWNVDVKATEEYTDMEMNSLSVRVQFMGSVEYEVERDSLPASGVVTVVSKASPLDRVNPPYPVECIPVCEAASQQVFDVDDPQCGTPPPYKPEWKIEHGWFVGDLETLDETYSKSASIESITNARSTQPSNAAVMGALDVGELELLTGTSPLSLHDYRVLNRSFGGTNAGAGFNDEFGATGGGAGFDDGFENHAIQNAVAVVTSAGIVTQGGEAFAVDVGDIIQIVDFTKLDDRPSQEPVPFGIEDEAEDGAFLHIRAADIIEEERTCYLRFGAGKPNPSRLSAFDIDVTSPNTGIGGKLAVYVEKFSDTDAQRTRDGEYFCEFGFNMCKVETPASIISPQCQPIPAYECNCRPLQGVLAQGLELTDPSNYDKYWLDRFDIRTSPQDPTTGGGFPPVTVEIIVLDESNGIEWVGSKPAVRPFVTGYSDCHAEAGQYAIATTWSLWKIRSFTTFGNPQETYHFNHLSTLIIQHDEVRLLDCIGKNDVAIIGRSVVHATGFTFYETPNGDPFAPPPGFQTEELARAAMNESISISKQDAEQAGNGYLCNLGGTRLSDNMTRGFMNVGVTIVQERSWYGDDIIDVRNVSTQEERIAASLHEWSLQRDTGCSYAVTLRYPFDQAETDAQRYDRHYQGLLNGVVSFADRETVVATTSVG